MIIIDKKFELTNDIIIYKNRELKRIRALKSFGKVRKGDLGGFVEKEDNLSHDGTCWIYDDAKVCDNAKIHDNASVRNNVVICNNVNIYNNVRICDNVKIHGYVRIYDKVRISENAEIYGGVQIYGNAEIYDNATIADYAIIGDNVVIAGDSDISGQVRILGNAYISGQVRILGNAYISGNAKVQSNKDYIVFKNFWSSGRYFTYTRSNKMWKVGCFYGTGKELVEKAYKDSTESGMNYQMVVNYVEQMEKMYEETNS